MSVALERMRLTWSEEQVLKYIAKIIPEGGVVVVSKLADETNTTRSVAVNALQKAAIAGVVETRSLGMKGTAILVRDVETWRELGQSA